MADIVIAQKNLGGANGGHTIKYISTDGDNSNYEKVSIFKMNSDGSEGDLIGGLSDMTDITKGFRTPIGDVEIKLREKTIWAKNKGYSEEIDEARIYDRLNEDLSGDADGNLARARIVGTGAVANNTGITGTNSTVYISPEANNEHLEQTGPDEYTRVQK